VQILCGSEKGTPAKIGIKRGSGNEEMHKRLDSNRKSTPKIRSAPAQYLREVLASWPSGWLKRAFPLSASHLSADKKSASPLAWYAVRSLHWTPFSTRS